VSTAAELIAGPKDPWDPTHSSDVILDHWTTTNLGEAVPGVISPLCTAYWNHRAHTTAVRVAYNVGVMSKRELEQQLPPEQRVTRFFYGRLTAKLEYMAMLGDRMPGVTGAQIIESLFNEAPEGLVFHPTTRRYAVFAVKMPMTFLTIQRRLRAMCDETDHWWRGKVLEIPALGLPAALDTFVESTERFQVAMDTHVTAMFGSFQPIFDLLERLVQRAGTGDLAVLSGTGGAEMAVVGDIWKASRGQLEVADIVRNHGFHGPGEGEVSSRVWREDDTPLRRAVEQYKTKPDDADPARGDAIKEQRRVAMTRELLAALPAARRPGAALIMKLARERIPDRGRGKRAFLQATDVGRMAARRAGALWAAEGVMDDPDDPFYLTQDELTRPLPRDVKELVAMRRQRRADYGRLAFRQPTFAGMPDVYEVGDGTAAPRERSDDDSPVTGVGASAGVVEGVVRVVLEPDFEDVEPGEVLVAPTTDPSWCSVMFVSAALVVDLGGMLSHAAVVARELAIPCVVNAGDATQRLRTGDTVRVDGGTGIVEILRRA
jgi:phosphohistidine swiveling domain-containing protein